MSKWFGFGSFFLAMAAGLIMAPIALGLALTKSGDSGCETATGFIGTAHAQESGSRPSDSNDESGKNDSKKSDESSSDSKKDESEKKQQSTKSETTTTPDDCAPTGGGSPSGDCSANGLAYGLPSASQADRESVFGKANSPETKKPVTFFGFELQAHEKVVPCLEAVEKEIKAKGLDDYKVRSAGAYNERLGEPLYFFHMYGAAIDINPDTNPMCDCTTHDIPDSWVKVFQDHGFFWGGNYRTTKDWMHFEWHGEKP